MSKKQDYHIVPHPEGWAVRREGSQHATSLHDTKARAIRAGQSAARKNRTELVIHGRDGRIHDSDSYGNDPFPPRDRRH